jgi:hypothetical protein
MSWETITEARYGEFSRYFAIGKPLWSRRRLVLPGSDQRRPHPADVPRDLPRQNPGAPRLLERRPRSHLDRNNAAYEGLLGRLGGSSGSGIRSEGDGSPSNRNRIVRRR